MKLIPVTQLLQMCGKIFLVLITNKAAVPQMAIQMQLPYCELTRLCARYFNAASVTCLCHVAGSETEPASVITT
jgi:hypothetical protein